MTRQSLEGKVALVTAAAGGGMGSVIAKRFGEEGATIVVTDAHERRVMETAEALSKELNQKVLGMKLDVRSQADIDACVGEVLKVHGHIDILYNNAGINKLSPVWKLSDADWDLVIGVCLTGTFRMVRAVLPGMIERKTGVVLNVSSIVGWHNDIGGPVGEGGQSAYAAVGSQVRPHGVYARRRRGSRSLWHPGKCNRSGAYLQRVPGAHLRQGILCEQSGGNAVEKGGAAARRGGLGRLPRGA